MNDSRRLVFLVPALLTFVVGWTAAIGQDPAPKYRQEYHVQFKGTPDKDPGFNFIGPDGEQCVHFEPDGLHIKLPNGQPKDRPPSGLSTGIVVKGDYEITTRFTILKEPEQKNAGPIGTRCGLLVKLGAEGDPKGVARVTWSMTQQDGTWFVAWTNANAGEQQNPKRERTTTRSGQLRLVRRGPTLTYYAAEADSNDFILLQEHQLPDLDLRDVSLVGQTNDPQAELEARFTELHIRAESLPSVPAQLLAGAATAAAPEPPTGGGQGWLLAIELLAVLLGLALAGGLGVWLYRRQAPATPPPAGQMPPASQAMPAIMSFPCACGKKLNVKAELVGKKVKCSQCGQAVFVPATQGRESASPGS